MADRTINPEEVERTMLAMLGQLTQARAPMLSQFAEAQTQRAARLAEAEKALSAELGADHPRVVALRASLASADHLKTTLAATSERAARRPILKPNEWMVAGRVMEAEGEPAVGRPDGVAGVGVRVFDRDRRFDDLLGETTTDEFGDFAVVYHERDFIEAGEALPELYVLVNDAQGNLLYSSRNSVRPKAGRVEYFEIILTGRAAPGGLKDRPPDAPPSPGLTPGHGRARTVESAPPKRQTQAGEQPTIKRSPRKK